MKKWLKKIERAIGFVIWLVLFIPRLLLRGVTRVLRALVEWFRVRPLEAVGCLIMLTAITAFTLWYIDSRREDPTIAAFSESFQKAVEQNGWQAKITRDHQLYFHRPPVQPFLGEPGWQLEGPCGAALTPLYFRTWGGFKDQPGVIVLEVTPEGKTPWVYSGYYSTVVSDFRREWVRQVPPYVK